jgi:hypothetical protein
MLEQLSRSLFEAISDSEDVHEHLQRLRQEGYSLNLLLDCQPDDPEQEEEAPAAQSRQALPPPRALQPASPPTFRINGTDLAFLRSVGIDPTRRCRTRRRAGDPEGFEQD